jgi:O-antigen/teichoic acid export membrane protein
VGLNLLAQGLPVVAAVVAVPPVLAALGEARFGVLALAWTLVSFFGLLDLGVGRALTKLLAESEPRSEDARHLVGTALAMALLLGVLAGSALAVTAPALVLRVLAVPPELAGEAQSALRLLALALPAAVVGTSLRGVLEARQRFDLATAVRAPMGVAIFAGPLLVLPLSTSLVAVVLVVVVVRVVALIGYLLIVARIAPWQPRPSRPHAARILGLGGWMTVSNVIAPLLLYLDRFVVASLISLQAVTLYVTPFEVISRLSIIPMAVMGVAFPAFSRSLAEDPRQADRLWRHSLVAVAALLAVPVLGVVFLARPLLAAWLDPGFAARAAAPAAILAVGVLVHGLAQPSFNLLQAAGRAHVTARLHLLEAPFYIGYMWWLTARFGIVGTACAWLLRVSASAIVLTVLARILVLGRPHPGGEGVS